MKDKEPKPFGANHRRREVKMSGLPPNAPGLTPSDQPVDVDRLQIELSQIPKRNRKKRA